MSLPTCQCNAGLPIQQQLGNIYCALLAVIAGQGGGGSITLAQISDMSAFWKNANAQTPAASTYLTSNGAGVFAAVPFANISVTTAQISDATAIGRLVVKALDTTGGSAGGFQLEAGAAAVVAYNMPQFAGKIANDQALAADGTTSPVNSVTIANGIITAIS